MQSEVSAFECDRCVTLSDRHVDILVLLARGTGFKTIANALQLSPATIAYHVGRLQRWFEAPSVSALVGAAMVLGVLSHERLPVEATTLRTVCVAMAASSETMTATAS